MVIHHLTVLTMVPVSEVARFGQLDDSYGAAHGDWAVDGVVVVLRVASVCCAQVWVDHCAAEVGDGEEEQKEV